MRRKLSGHWAVVAAGAMLAGGMGTAHADSWFPTSPEGTVSYGFTDTFGAYSPVSIVLAEPDAVVAVNMRGDGTPADMSKDLLCDSYDVGPCSDRATGFNMRILLPPCSATITTWCIDGVRVSAAPASPAPATLIRSTQGRSYVGDPARGLPSAGSVSLWSAAGVKHGGGTDTYAATVMVDAGKLSTAGDIYVYGLTASITPYRESTDGFFRAPRVSQSPGRTPWPIDVTSDGSNCVWVEDGRCGVREDFATDTRATLTLRLGNSITGWLNGRLSDPTVEITTLSATQNLLTVTGTTVAVPQIQASLTPAQWSELSTAAPGLFPPGGGGSRADDWPSVSRQLPALAKYLNDKAAGVLTQWTFATTGSRNTDPCLKDDKRLVGLVTTNAAVYESGAPGFADQFLQYRVGGVHSLPDGTLATGVYDLYMRSDAARCLYKFTNAPVSATVSVVNSDGTTATATTVLKEADGWLHLQAAGFTFSNKVIRVRLTGTADKATAPTKTVVKKITITCVKGTVKKKVTAVAPKCPTGWKVRKP